MIPQFYEALKKYMQQEDLINVAVGKRARQSSFSKWSSGDEASRAVNGTFNGNFSFHTNEERDPWWMLDLERIYPIALIVIHNRKDACQERAQKLKVSISDNETSWITIHEGQVHFTDAENGVPLILPLMSSISGRFVKISIDDFTYLHLSQVEILVARKHSFFDQIIKNSEKFLTSLTVGSKINIGVLGTSNSIMTDGYTKHLTHDPKINLVSNMSLGSSHPTVAPFRVNEETLRSCDAIIIDLSVNEQNALYQSAYNQQITIDIFYYILRQCQAHDVLPLFLIMPEALSYSEQGKQAFKARNLYRELCITNSVPFFDAYSMVELFASSSGSVPRAFLKDAFHLDAKYATYLGRLLGRSIVHLLQNARKSAVKKSCSSFHFAPIEIERFTHLDNYVRTTSIVSARTVFLRKNDEIFVDFAEGSEVYGMVLNMSNCCTSVTISGIDCVSKNLSNSYYTGSQRNWIVCWSLINPVKLQDGHVRLISGRADNRCVYEINDHGNCDTDVPDDERGIELAGLIIKSDPEYVDIMTIGGIENDIWLDWCLRGEDEDVRSAFERMSRSKP